MTSNDRIGSKALKPNPALQPLAFLIGDWRTTGTHPLTPGASLPGWTRFAWHQGGAFLLMQSEVDHPDFPDGVAIFGSDEGAGTVVMNWFDERGISRLYQVRVGDGCASWSRDDPKLAQRLTISADGADRLVSKGEMSEAGGRWSADLSQTFTRDASIV